MNFILSYLIHTIFVGRSVLAKKTRYRDMSDSEEEEEGDWDKCEVETTQATQSRPKSKGSKLFSMKKN